jgi:DNA-binding response OmpR family regulator
MKQRTVLLVEDNQSLRAIMEQKLKAEGFKVLATDSGEDALMLADHADLAILDLKLPDMHGREILRALRSDRKNFIPVVIATAKTPANGEREDYEGFGILDFLEKPFKMSTLIEMIRQKCDVCESIDEIDQSSNFLKKFNRKVQGQSDTGFFRSLGPQAG